MLLQSTGPFVTGFVSELLESMALQGISGNRSRPRDLNLIFNCGINRFTSNDKFPNWNRDWINYTRCFKTPLQHIRIIQFKLVIPENRPTPCLTTLKRSFRVGTNIIESCFHASGAFLAKVKQKRGSHIQGIHKILRGTNVVALRGAYKSNQPLSCRCTHKNAHCEPRRPETDSRVADRTTPLWTNLKRLLEQWFCCKRKQKKKII